MCVYDKAAASLMKQCQLQCESLIIMHQHKYYIYWVSIKGVHVGGKMKRTSTSVCGRVSVEMSRVPFRYADDVKTCLHLLSNQRLCWCSKNNLPSRKPSVIVVHDDCCYKSLPKSWLRSFGQYSLVIKVTNAIRRTSREYCLPVGRQTSVF
jgi:hypothetical protein